MTTRAKFYCAAVNPSGEGTDEYTERLTFHAVTSDTEENKTWSKYTPAGTLDIYISNPALVGKFKEGEEYYLDISPCAPGEAEAQTIERTES